MRERAACRAGCLEKRTKKARSPALFSFFPAKGSDDDAAYRDEPVAPVGLHVLPAYGLAAAGAVDEGIVAGIKDRKSGV